MGSFAQHVIPNDPESLPHRMTAEEELRRHEIGRDFYPTLPPAGPVRQVAEFEHMQSVLIRYPFGIPLSLIAEMSQDCMVTTIVLNAGQENTVRSQYTSAGVNLDNCDFIHAPTDSYWTRDYGPWFVVNGNHDVGICNFPYNRPRPNDNDIPIEVAEYLGIELYGMNLIHTGGNYMCDGISNAASSDLVWEENPTLSHEAIENLVDSYLGVETYHVLPDPLGEYIKHIDCWAKFLDVDKVLVGEVEPWDPRYDDYEYVADYFAETPCAYGYHYQVYRVFTPGDYPYTPYTNSLILNKKVFVPITGSQYDDEAVEVYEEAMPGYEVFPILYSSWENTDALHCRAKGIADIGMLYVRHFPLFGILSYADAYEVSAEIIPYSGEPVYDDSLLVYYQVNGGEFSTVPLLHDQDYTYKGYIPEQPAGSEVAYYIHAADESGRSVDHPLIGAPDPHVFTIGAQLPDVTVTPDSLVYTETLQAVEGQMAYIVNETEYTIQINDITNEGYDPFLWYVEPWPITLPYSMSPGDSLILTVFIAMPLEGLGEMLVDTMFIESEASVHDVTLVVDSDIIQGIEEHEDYNLLVYPNPVTDRLSIRFKAQDTRYQSFEVYSISGELVRTGMIESNAGVNETTISVSDLPSGIYILKLHAGDQLLTRKIIIN
jgi:agmatine/peptidylarginine deiminase